MAQTWVVIGIFGAFAAVVLQMMWSEMLGLRGEVRSLDTKLSANIRGLSQEVHTLAERQAQMNGQLDVVVRQAHTHPVG